MFSQFKRLAWKASLITTVVSMLAFTIALAAPGDLDTTFSGDGRQNTDFGGSHNDFARAIAIQSDGKIVVVGERDTAGAAGYVFAIARYKAGGALDTAFSGDGRQTTNFSSAWDSAQAVAIQSDGKIVVSGSVGCNSDITAGCKIGLARYNSGGSLDTSFSVDGKQTATISGLNTFSFGGLAIQPDGKILVAGTVCGANASSCNFAILRFNANGSLDTTFSGDGKLSVGFGSNRDDGATDLALQNDGKIVVEGWTADTAATNCYMAVARLTSAGVLDTTFSGDGRQTVNFGGTTCFSNNGSVAIDGNGRIVLGGYKSDGTNSNFALARLTSAGALDTTFAGTGKKVTIVPGGGLGSKIKVVGGKIILAGRSSPSGNQDFAVLRYNSNGSLDTAFSGDGVATFDFSSDRDIARGMAVDGNGKYVLVGQTSINSQDDFGIVRVLP